MSEYRIRSWQSLIASGLAIQIEIAIGNPLPSMTFHSHRGSLCTFFSHNRLFLIFYSDLFIFIPSPNHLVEEARKCFFFLSSSPFIVVVFTPQSWTLPIPSAFWLPARACSGWASLSRTTPEWKATNRPIAPGK